MSGSQPLWEWDWDYAIHDALGTVATAIVIVGLVLLGLPWWLSAAMIPIQTGGGYLREKIQHDWDRLTPHQHAEALLWGIGSVQAVAGAAVYFLFFTV